MDVYERILTTLVQEFSDLAQVEHITRATLRLVLAMFLGGLLGYERELMGKAAGMRTHMLVCLGAAIFVMALEQDGAEADAMSRVIQGIAAGVGFLGAGTILKGQNISDVKGLTTAAGCGPRRHWRGGRPRPRGHRRAVHGDRAGGAAPDAADGRSGHQDQARRPGRRVTRLRAKTA